MSTVAKTQSGISAEAVKSEEQFNNALTFLFRVMIYLGLFEMLTLIDR